MPIYAFQCTACGHTFDRLQKLADPDPTACPSCSTEAVKRQVTAPAFRLSGTGWYETDFKSKGEKTKNLTDSGGEGAKSGGEGAAAATASAPAAASAPAPAKAETKAPAASS
jgi:putative FmdB family regulatory protein